MTGQGYGGEKQGVLDPARSLSLHQYLHGIDMHSHFFIKQAAMSSTGPFQIRDTYIRVDTMADTYARMAELAFALFLDGAADPSPLLSPMIQEGLWTKKSVAANGIKTIVFSAMAIEAAVLIWRPSSSATR